MRAGRGKMTAALHVVILAAGEGKRMKSTLPKVLQPIAGRPMLAHVIAAARELQPAAIHVVYGHGGDAGARGLRRRRRPALGRAGAAARHRPRGAAGHARHPRRRARAGAVRRRAADRRAKRCNALLASPGALAVLGAELADPTGYGRIVLRRDGRVARHRRAQGRRAPAQREHPHHQHRHRRRRRRATARLARPPAATTTRRASTT